LASGCSVIGVDDFSRGTEQNIARARKHPKFELHTADLADENAVLSTLAPLLAGRPIAEVWHLAANSDIPAGVRYLHDHLQYAAADARVEDSPHRLRFHFGRLR
jgi:UDP-glucose 4-epimerase